MKKRSRRLLLLPAVSVALLGDGFVARTVTVLLCICLACAAASAQALTSLSGTVADPTGAMVPGVGITLEEIDKGVTRTTISDEAGRYRFPQIAPGKYRLTAKAADFADVVIEKLQLFVNTPATVDVRLQRIKEVKETVTVTSETIGINVSDASLGNAIGTTEVLQLPLYLRNVVGLLTFQPGVTSFSASTSDDRNGSVNGGKSDQANVTLDGIDVNDHLNRFAFTSVLRVTLDSVSEFRTTTTNAGADQGRTSGAEIALVTKSGTNDLHGALYDFHRNTATAANSFFNNQVGIPRPALLVDVFGAAVGGPVKRNRLFFFVNYEGRRDRSGTTVLRTVPSDELRQGIVQYLTTSGDIARLTPEDLKTRIDPAGIGVNNPVLELMQSYPRGNDFSAGDGLNTIGYRFAAPLRSKTDTYTARLDYVVDAAGRHNVFWRGNLQNDHGNGAPQFPGDPPASVSLNNSKGFAAGWNAVWRPNLISTTRFGFTRPGFESSGLQAASAITFFGFQSRFALTRGFTSLVPGYHWTQDLAWNRGPHEFKFGGTVRRIRNPSRNFGNSFHDVYVNPVWLRGSGNEFQTNVPDLDPSFRSRYRVAVVDALGLVTNAYANYNYDTQGNAIPVGEPLRREFANEEYEMYAQDTWRVTPALTVSAGLRYSLMPPVYETNGYQVSTNIPLGDWFNQRGGLGDSGRSQAEVGKLTYILRDQPGGRPLYPFHKKNFAPRFSIAWSPQSNDGFLRWLTGGPGKTSIRAGWGMFYELLGQPISAVLADRGSFGLTSRVTNPAGTLTALTSPRFTGIYDIPPELIPPPPPGVTFPLEAPPVQGFQAGIDDKLKPPYTMNMSLSVGREFRGGLFVQASYVGRQSRRSLISRDLALPTNLKDSASGMTYYQAAAQMLALWRQDVPVEQVQPIPYWENLWPGAASGGLTATQAVYDVFRAYNVDTTAALYDLDVNCAPSCSRLGPFAMFNEQIAGLSAYASVAGGNYHAMQWTVRKHLGSDLRFDLNYTWSKSIDLASNAARILAGDRNHLITWDPKERKGVSEYDVTHTVNAFAIWQLPIGKGKKFLGGRRGFLDVLAGGWQLSGSWSQSSGLPTSVYNGFVWPTSWWDAPFGTQVGPAPRVKTTKNAPAIVGPPGPNIFPDPKAARESYDFTLPGKGGQRNGLRGDGVFNINLGVGKRFTMPYNERHSIQFRWESFNLTNTVRFGTADNTYPSIATLDDVSSFGKYTSTLSSPRQMQFVLRYEF